MRDSCVSGSYYVLPDPMHHAKIFKGQPRRCASVHPIWELVPKW